MQLPSIVVQLLQCNQTNNIRNQIESAMSSIDTNIPQRCKGHNAGDECPYKSDCERYRVYVEEKPTSPCNVMDKPSGHGCYAFKRRII